MSNALRCNAPSPPHKQVEAGHSLSPTALVPRGRARYDQPLWNPPASPIALDRVPHQSLCINPLPNSSANRVDGMVRRHPSWDPRCTAHGVYCTVPPPPQPLGNKPPVPCGFPLAKRSSSCHQTHTDPCPKPFRGSGMLGNRPMTTPTPPPNFFYLK